MKKGIKISMLMLAVIALLNACTPKAEKKTGRRNSCRKC